MAKPKFKIKHSISKKEWNKTHKDFKSIIDGIHYVMKLTDKGTALVPVNIEESVDENFAVQMAVAKAIANQKVKNPETKKDVKVTTALKDKNHPAHKQAKSLFQRIKDKLMGEGVLHEVEMGDMGYVEKHKSIATVYGVMGKKLKVKLGKTGKVVTIDSKDIRIMSESVNEKYSGRKSDFVYDMEQALENNGIPAKAIKRITKVGKGYEVRMSSYMRDEKTWKKLGNEIGAELVDFKKGSINIGLYESIDEKMVAPRRGHAFYKLTKDTSIKYISGHSGIGLKVPRVLLHNEYDTINGKKGAYIIDYFGQHFYVDMKNKFASKIAHPHNREQNKDLMKNTEEVYAAPDHSDWKKYLKESVNEGIEGMSKEQLDRVARGMFGKSYSRLTMDQTAKLKFYLRKSKKESVEESVNEANAQLNKKVKKYLDDYLRDEKKNSPEHQESIMLIMRGALTDANFHSEARELKKYFPKAKGRYIGTPMEDVIEDKGVQIAKWAKWDGYDIIDAFAFYTSMSIGGSFGAKFQSLKESLNEAYIVTYTKKKGEKPASAAFQLRGSALSFEKDLKKDGYITMITQKKVKGVDESVNEGKDPEIITQLRDVVKNGYKTLKDPKSGKRMKVDTYSASAIVGVYDKLNSSNKEKFVKQGLLGMQSLAFKFIK